MVEKREKPFSLDMSFGEALGRYAKTDPKEVHAMMEKPVQTDFKAQLNTVDFHGHVLQVIASDGRPFVPLNRICVNLGIDWSAQLKRIQRDQVLSEGLVMMTIPTPGGPQQMACLPLEYLNGWLFGIDENRVAPEVRDALIMYKREAYGALYNYFVKGFAINRERLDEDESAREAAIQELRKLRTSDKSLYKKVTDAIAYTSVDYEATRQTTPNRVSGLFARIQDTFHVAVSGKTSAKLVLDHADGEKPLVGMTAYDGPENKITTQDVRTGKNYLTKTAFRQLEILYELLFLFAENKIIAGDTMTLAKWEDQLQKLLLANGFEPRGMYEGEFLPTRATTKAEHELKKFKERRAIEGGKT
jgi:hypothetical protein